MADHIPERVVNEFLLGTHEPGWLGRSPASLFVSLERRHKFPRRPRTHTPGYGLDSGGFTVVTSRGGWSTTSAQHLEAVYEVADLIIGMKWAAPQDWMCEEAANAATGLSVDEHQHRTVDNFCQLAEIDERGLIIPVLQGRDPGEHERCVEMYQEAGVDLSDRLVGVGTICRRQATRGIEDVVRSLSSMGLRLHGFGVKTSGLGRYGDALYSADSLAWSFRARKAHRHGEGSLGAGCSHVATQAACNNCFVWAHQWRERVLAASVRSRP